MADPRRIASAIANALPNDGLQTVVAMAALHLDMDVAFVAEFVDGRQIYRALAGDAVSFGMAVGTGPPLAQTYCSRLTSGEIPPLIPDTRVAGEVRDLRATPAGTAGAYIGVPLRFSDGRLFGSFCCVSAAPDPKLNHRDLGYLELLGLVLTDQLERVDRHRTRHDEIEVALADGEIAVALQPIVRLADHSVAGAEALARFPSLGRPPDVVLEQAHEVGLGVEVEVLAIRSALAHIPHVPDGAYLSINTGPTAMLSPAFTDTLREAPLDRVCVELTEHTSVKEYAQLQDTITPLRDDGLLLAVDDVGAGYASLRHVLQLHPDILKIDRSLIDGIANDPGRRSIVTSIVLLALDLDALVIAEGVEAVSDRETLTDLGVDMMQGYLFAKPSTEPSDWRRWTDRPAAALARAV